MLKNYIKSTLRNIFRNQSFSIINILGLALSMSICLLIIMIIKDQNSFDNFHAKADNIYRLNTSALRKNNSTEDYATTVSPLAEALSRDFSQIENGTMIHFGLRGEFEYGTTQIPFRGYFTDPGFFQVFDFPVQGGGDLSEPYTVMLTDEYVEKLFGQDDPIGKVIQLNGETEYTVTGIISKKDYKTHFDFDALASRASIPSLIQQGSVRNFIDDWSDIYATYTYVEIPNSAELPLLEEQINLFANENFKDVTIESRTKSFSFYFQSLKDITPGPILSNNMGNAMPAVILNALAIFSILILLTACFNFTNLSIARSLSRAKEIGVRKVQGAARSQVFLQFISESVIFSIISMIVAFGILQFIIPGFSQLEMASSLNLNLELDSNVFLLFGLFSILCGLIAGIIPSWYLSAFNPLKVIRNQAQVSMKKGPWITRMGIRKGLMVFQFGLCLLFVFMSILAGNQARFMMNKEIGLNTTNILNVNLGDVTYAQLLPAVNQIAGVEEVTGISIPLGTWADQSDDYRKSYEVEKRSMRDFFVDENYIEVMDIQMLAGSSFPSEASANREQFILINEQALDFFFWETPQDAVGQGVIIGDSTEVIVAGVVKDFHFRPMTNNIGPMAFRYRPSSLRIMNIRVNSGNQTQTIAALENVWKEFDPDHAMDREFMETGIRDSYGSFRDFEKITGFFALLAISVASLGLLGMVIFTLQSKLKEVGIRKVLGATEKSLYLLLSKQFLLLLGLAIALFLPIAILLGTEYLASFAYKIDIGIILIAGSILIISAIAIITIATQVWHTTRVNPVKIVQQN